jgi:hypothetical protein
MLQVLLLALHIADVALQTRARPVVGNLTVEDSSAAGCAAELSVQAGSMPVIWQLSGAANNEVQNAAADQLTSLESHIKDCIQH